MTIIYLTSVKSVQRQVSKKECTIIYLSQLKRILSHVENSVLLENRSKYIGLFVRISFDNYCGVVHFKDERLLDRDSNDISGQIPFFRNDACLVPRAIE